MGFTMEIWKELALEAAFLAVCVAIVAFLYRADVVSAALILAVCLVALKFWHKREDVSFLLMGAVLGPSLEMICVHFNAWQYTQPTFLGIPLWLPFGWGLVALLVRRITETFLKIISK